MKVLIADDDATIRSELAELLREHGHDVAVASDGAEAIRKLEGEAFDVALLDLMMPRANGLDVLRRVHVVRPSTAVIMITGQGTIDTAVEAMKSGALDFVEKPFEVEAIERTLRGLDEERQARRLLAGPGADPSFVQRMLDDAADRKALLAVVGPGGTPPAKAARVLRLAEDPSPPDVYAPNQLYQLNAAVEDHVARAERPVVVLANLDILAGTHGRRDVVAWIRQLGSRCGAKDGTVIVAGADAPLSSAVEAAQEAGHGDAGLQGMLGSLANPVRRAIVGYVFTSGPVAYSLILRRNFVDSSSKLSFHLGKLQTDGLLKKVEGGAYALTEDGRRAWRVLKALAEDGRQPVIVFRPPA